MEIKILHLYGDIMNLYGEYANVSALSRCLSEHGHTVSITHFSLLDSFSLSDYDFYYMGCGTERNQKHVLEHLLPHRDEIKNAIENGAVMLFTGNSWEMLGKYIEDSQGTQHKAMGIFDFKVKEGKRRITSDALGTSEFFNTNVVGFINKCSAIQGVHDTLFSLELGKGNDNSSTLEGIHFNNFFGTHIVGPLLIKNPDILNRICKIITKSEADFSSAEYAQEAYKITVDELKKRITSA